MKHSVLVLFSLLAAAPATARDTLEFFQASSASTFYRDRSIVAQAARFDLGAPAYVRRLTIWLGGRTTGTASVTLYGNEGAFAAPLLGQPLTNGITVRKDRPGVEKVEVLLPPDVFVERPQFFVVVSDLSDGIVLLSDRHEKRPRCVDGTDRWLYQAIKGADGVWRAGKYGYAIEAIVDYPEEIPPTYLADITLDAGFPEDLLSPFVKGGPSAEGGRGGSIAWADVDNDTRLDVMVSNRLFINKGDDRFEEATDRLDIAEEEEARAHHFIDIDNDADFDILLLGMKEGVPALLENDGDGWFSRRDLVLPLIMSPSTVSFADADRDGYLDVFVGEGMHDSGDLQPGYLLINTGKNGFNALMLRGMAFVPSQPADSHPRPVADSHTRIISSQWFDADNDGDPDLYLTAGNAAESRLLINDGAGNLAPNNFNAPSATNASSLLHPDLRIEEGGGILSPSDLADANSDGNPDLLQPVTYNAADLGSTTSTFGPLDIPYQGFSGGGTWADVDNDGRLDALITSSCDCRFASLYTQDPSGRFTDKSFEYGLFRLPAGADAVWVDFNNDGKLDVATFVGGQFRLLKNTGDFSANFIEVDLIPSFGGVSAEGGRGGGQAIAQAIGGTVTIHYGDQRQTRPIVSGRGALMQGPLRVHFGLGDVASVDSLVVEWNGAERRTLANPALNKIHYPFDNENAATSASANVAFTAWPNPFRTSLNFKYTLQEKGDVRLEIYGLDGESLAVLLDEEQEAGEHSTEWYALDANGSPLPAGTYIYRARIGNQILTGRAVLTK